MWGWQGKRLAFKTKCWLKKKKKHCIIYHLTSSLNLDVKITMTDDRSPCFHFDILFLSLYILTFSYHSLWKYCLDIGTPEHISVLQCLYIYRSWSFADYHSFRVFPLHLLVCCTFCKLLTASCYVIIAVLCLHK